jgi:predicted alpha/beta hydrolase
MQDLTETTSTIPARDGFSLAATRFASADVAPDAPHVVMQPATAVPRKIYAPLARFLAARGAIVTTYDYRGVGGSRPRSLRGFRARMRDWAALDAAGVVDHVLSSEPGRRLLGIGHSFGGQAFVIQPGNERFNRVLMVAAQAGYWRLTAARGRGRVYTMMKAGIPAVALLAGYVPGRRLGLGEDLPLGVFLEWRRWVLSPRYFFDDPTLDLLGNAPRLSAPVLAVGTSDDPWATPPAIDLLVSGLPNAPVERRTITPAQAGVAKIGHFDLFRADHQKTVWPELTDWLLAP